MQENNLILKNANVITMDPICPITDFIAIRNNIILSISKKDMNELSTADIEIINCRGKTILPGFIDAHCHFFGLAESLVLPDISPQYARSISDIEDIIKKAAEITPSGSWIRARGYHLFHLLEKRHPNRWDLDKVAKYHPVCLTHNTAYIHVLNSLALSMANINSTTPEPPGGLIERDLETGEPNGILYGMGTYLSKVIPHLEESQIINSIKLAGEKLIFMGIASVHEPSRVNDIIRWNILSKCKNLGILTPRIAMAIGTEAYSSGQFKEISEGDNFLNTRGIKIVLSETTGELYPSRKELNEIVLQIHQAGIQVMIHAVEQHVIEAAVDSIEYAIRKYPRNNHRHRIEHCSVCTPELAKRLTKLGIVVVSQPNFVFYNGERYLKTVPQDQLPHLYPFKTLLDSGLNLAAGSDCPVVPANPWDGIYSAVTRKSREGSYLTPTENISVMDAIKMYTISAAYALFEEHIKGSITAGKLADLIILNEDPTKIKPHEIQELQIEMVILDGKIAFRKGL